MGTITRSKAEPVSLTNIVDTGTEGTKVAVGTTGQRGVTTGQWRFNSATGYFEGIGTGGAISSLEPDPAVDSVDVVEVDSTAGGNVTIVVTGTNYSTGGTIAFIGSSAEFNAASTTHDSTTQQTAVAPKASFLNAQEPYKVKFTSASGKSGQSTAGLINVDSAPTWTTASGSVGTVLESTALPSTQLTASDAEGDAITYSETTSALSGAGFSLSSVGVITGTSAAVGGDTTTNFTVRATANSKTSDRAFSILTKDFQTSQLLYDGTNTDPAGNNPSGTNASVNTNVTLTSGASSVNSGGSQTFRQMLAGSSILTARSDTYSHYNPSDLDASHENTIWSISGSNSNHNAPYLHFGVYQGTPNTDIWATIDLGQEPSFKLTRMTGYSVWGTGTANFQVWGDNGTTNLPDSNRGSFNGTGMNKILDQSLSSSTNWDTGYQTSNIGFYRYLTIRCLATSGSYDWGWNTTKWYGDYY